MQKQISYKFTQCTHWTGFNQGQCQTLPYKQLIGLSLPLSQPHQYLLFLVLSGPKSRYPRNAFPSNFSLRILLCVPFPPPVFRAHENKSIASIQIEGFLNTGCLECRNEKDKCRDRKLCRNHSERFTMTILQRSCSILLYNCQGDFRPLNVQSWDIVIYSKKCIFDLHLHFWHRAPETPGIS